MNAIALHEYLVNRLKTIDKNLIFSAATAGDKDWLTAKAAVEKELAKLRATVKFSGVLAIVLGVIVIAVCVVKIFDISLKPDLNKGALLILLTLANVVTVFRQKMRIAQLEQQLLLLDMLVKISASEKAIAA